MKKQILLSVMCLVAIASTAQETHVIEPAILEVRYDSWQEEHDDSYILRIGKTANQFFSFFRYRTDSLMFTSEETSKIALQEFIDTNDRSEDRSKRLKVSTIGREWLYQDLTTDKLLYSDYASAYNTYEEDIPKQEWEISADSVMTILGMECHKVTTMFRGRLWGGVVHRGTSHQFRSLETWRAARTYP